ncbi:MAG: hypothetical protein GX542_11115 [Rhodococcus sp.]|nr:hypothetical protein [Rhodococcus sp. (in: high G+C Gram-positive bacteria)]
MNFRKTAMRAFVASVLAAGVAFGAAGTSTAAPAPAQGYTGLSGSPMWVLGDNAWCSGHVEVLIETDVERPGTVALTLIPLGASGQGPAWTANPVCNLKIAVTRLDGIFPFNHVHEIPVSMGPERGEPIRTEFATTSGLTYLNVTAPAFSQRLEFRPQYGVPYGGYFLIP